MRRYKDVDTDTSEIAQKEMSKERTFIETLVGQRFNFFIVFFSLIVGGAVNAKSQIMFQIILSVGMAVGWLITYTLVVAHIKLERVLARLAKHHPYSIVQDEVSVTGRKFIGWWIQILCSLILSAGAVLSWLSFISV